MSILSLSRLSSIRSNGMLFVTSIETQVVRRLRLFLLNTVSPISVLFTESSETVTLSSLLGHTYFRAFLFPVKYCLAVVEYLIYCLVNCRVFKDNTATIRLCCGSTTLWCSLHIFMCF